ncbi:MAG: uroporphyrinogen decarboxylase family protein [Candidatus Omnitrophota bacterium]
MTSRERIKALFASGAPDRIPVFDMFPGAGYACGYSDIIIHDVSCVKSPDREKFNMAAVTDPFETLSHEIGFENAIEKIAADPRWISEKLESITEGIISGLEARRDMISEMDGIWLWADMAYNKGTYFGPLFYAERLLPLHRRLCGYFSGMSLPVVIHSDGNISDILRFLPGAGFKGVHPLESKAGMRLRDADRECGGQMVLFGNMDAGVLRSAMTGDALDRVAEKLEEAKGVKAYVFGFEEPVSADMDGARYGEVVEFVRSYGFGRITQKDLAWQGLKTG